jgi:hypothetical protein
MEVTGEESDLLWEGCLRDRRDTHRRTWRQENGQWTAEMVPVKTDKTMCWEEAARK